MRISTRLSGGFGAIVLIVVLLAGISIINMYRFSNQTQKIKNESVPHALLSQEMALNVAEVQQFFTDVGATREPDAFKEAEEAAKAFKDGLSKFREMFKNENDSVSLAKLDTLSSQFDSFYVAGKRMAEAYIAEGVEGGNRTMRDFDKMATVLDKEIKEFRDQQSKEISEVADKMASDSRLAVTVTIIFGAVAVLIGIITSIVITRRISRPIAACVDTANRLAEGDLTMQIDASGSDEIGSLMAAMKSMTDNLRGIVSQVASSSSQVVASAGQLHTTAEKIATNAEEVADQASTVATAGEEMSATSSDIAQNCVGAAEGAQHATRSAQSGVEVVERTVVVMGQIAERVQESAKTVERLGERSDQIGTIIGTIEDIADQTNLLALNAAIEAARAGEQGRGFAVVADEVRALAERTTRATREIGEMIKAIQSETKGAVAAMEQGVQQVESGTREAERSGAALMEILDQVNSVAMQVSQIATAAEEQTATTSEISSNMHQITQIVQQTSRGAQESATAAAQLSSNAEELQRLVRQFRL